jgi:hypothetical protein
MPCYKATVKSDETVANPAIDFIILYLVNALWLTSLFVASERSLISLLPRNYSKLSLFAFING